MQRGVCRNLPLLWCWLSSVDPEGNGVAFRFLIRLLNMSSATSSSSPALEQATCVL